MSQKGDGSDQPDQPLSASVPKPVGSEPSHPAAVAVASALRTFAATISKQQERQSDVIDVFASAMKELNAELQKTRARAYALETRLHDTEGRLEYLERMVAALGRQGWVQ